MIAGIITIIITILVAPFMFWLLSHKIYSKSNLKKYPTQINDGIGDLIFLPLFNGVLIELIASTNYFYNSLNLLIAIILSLFLTFLYVHYQKNITNYLDWSKPKKGVLNFGGWYHAGYMLVQMIIIFWGLSIFYQNYLLWVFIGGYILTTVIQIIKDGYI